MLAFAQFCFYSLCMSEPVSPTNSTAAEHQQKSVYTIPAGVDFAAELARGIMDRANDPQDSARALIMVPSRRAARALRGAFLNICDGKTTLLPRMVPIGDVDDDDPDILMAPELGVALPPPVNDLRRTLILAQLLEGFQLGGHKPTPAQAMQLARSLGQLLDQLHNADAEPALLRDLLPEQFSLHWQDILKLLSILIDRWPDILRGEGVMDAADRRNRLTKARTAAWRDQMPTQLIVLAGSTGTFAATRSLIDCVASLPRGHVVLPGLDHGAADHWHVIRADSGHPQHQLSLLLAHLDVKPADVLPWNSGLVLPQIIQDRHLLMREMFKPAVLTTEWRQLPSLRPDLGRDALKGLELIECQDKQSEAAVIAVTMREVLEVPNKTAALITPDRQLAEAVVAELKRWDIIIDDSAGQPLSSHGTGKFLQLLANAAAHDFAPVHLLALFKHPLMASGLDQATCKMSIRHLERLALRGYRPQSGLDGVLQQVSDQPDLHAFVVNHIIAPLDDFINVWQSPAPTLARLSLSLAEACEKLAARQCTADGHHDADDGALHLWEGPGGEAGAQLMRDLSEYGDKSSIDPIEFPQILAQLLDKVTVRGQWQSHARLAILGPVEARMQSADCLIIAGFNEGHWPPQPDVDPWMNGSMRDIVGLPARNWRSGLSAHDIFMAICAPTVIVTRSLREKDAATTPSRWLQRLTAVMRSLEIEQALPRGQNRLRWVTALEPIGTQNSLSRPVPKPPVAVRPREFSATEIDRWIEDPYAIYARRILNLRRLDELDPPPDAALRGNLVHDSLATFIAAYPSGTLPDDALSILRAMARKEFEPQWHIPSVQYFWWPRFESVAAWFIEEERRRRAIVARSLVEIQGAVTLDGPAGDVTLKARADRLDMLTDGSIAVIDYKTGSIPRPKEVADGRRTQLLVEALIAAEGGYKDTKAGVVGAMEYWQLSGKQGAVSKISDVYPEGWSATNTRIQLEKLIAQFDDPEMGYASQPDRKYKPRFSDYEHLARVNEWSAGADDE